MTNDEFKEFLLARDDVSCAKEYGTPIVKGKITGTAKNIANKVTPKIAGFAVRKVREKTEPLEGGKGVKLLKFALEQGDKALHKPPKKPSPFKICKDFLIKKGLWYDIDTPKKLKKFEKLQKKKQKKLAKKLKKKSPIRYRIVASLMARFIAKWT